MVLDDAPVDQILDLRQTLRPKRLMVGEVEPELVGPDGGAGLGDVLPQTSTESCR
jgi:hypothetical protein